MMIETGLVGRKAIMKDVDMIYEWANDEETRKQSLNSEKIVYENHVEWFGKKIIDKNSLFLIFELNDEGHEPVGSIRLDLEEDNKYLLSYQIAPKMRGKGYGKQMISSLERVLPEEYNMKDILIEAEVKKQNIASCRCFERNDYFKEEREGSNIYSKSI